MKIKTFWECPICLFKNSIEVLKPNHFKASLVNVTCKECESSGRAKFYKGKALHTVAYGFDDFEPSLKAKEKLKQNQQNPAQADERKDV